MELERFGAALDAIRRRVEAEVGAEDVAYIRHVDRISRTAELAGRVLLHVCFEPVGFTAGVGCLWIGKQLQATEIGHAVMHGAYDRLAAGDRFRADTFVWKMPFSEAVWHELHNLAHHSHTNVAGRDPGRGIAWRAELTLRMVRKALPYYAREYVLFPALAGPLFWKVLLGNWLSELIRDTYSILSIYANHDGHDVAYYEAGTRAKSRAEWYLMQVEATNNFAVPLPVSILCGALDRHIEHHLFPRLPPNRLREVSREVRRVCEEHGVAYKEAGWGTTLRKVWRELRRPTMSAPRRERMAS